MPLEQPYDYSTLDLEAIYTLPHVHLKPTQYPQIDPGVRCDFLPPGHPAYFARRILGLDSEPVDGRVVFARPVKKDERQQFYLLGEYDFEAAEPPVLALDLLKYWKPLPYTHIRVTLWEWELYTQLYGCVFDPVTQQVEHGVDFYAEQDLLEYHAAYINILAYYPEAKVRRRWALFQPDDGSNLEKGFLWRNRWIACQHQDGTPVQYGWQRYHLPQFEKGVR